MLSWVIPPGLVDEAVGDGLAWEMRPRSLPARLGVYFVLGCALLSGDPYPDVIREITKGAGRALAAVGWAAPATTTWTARRDRPADRSSTLVAAAQIASLTLAHSVTPQIP